MKVGVIGGGIAGLVTTLALQQKGIDVQLYEASDVIRAAGAGIWMSPNSIKIMERLGVVDIFKKQSNEMKRVQIERANGSAIRTVHMDQVKRMHGYAIHAVKRQTLHNLLSSGIETDRIHSGKRLTGLKQTSSSVFTIFSDRTQEEFDAVIGADGLHSTVRDVVNPSVLPRSTDQFCWYGLSDASISDSLHSMTTEIWMGDIRFGFAGVEDNQVYFFAVENNAKLDSPATILNKKEYLLNLFSGGPENIRKILSGSENNKSKLSA